MRPWMRWALIVIATLAGTFYWLLIESHVPAGEQFPIDIAEIRRLANSISGAKPQSIRYEEVATFKFPAAAIMAGDSWRTETAPAVSYQLVYPDRAVIIDTAMDQKTTEALGRATFHPEPYARMIQAMSAASLILITHEHPDHIGGLATHPGLAKLPARLTREQIDHPEKMVPVVFPDGALATLRPLECARYLAAAPGVVLIKAPGHSPGSQMIFVQKSDGVEFLFLGDVAWQSRNVENVRERPRLLTFFMLHEDRTAVLLELDALHRLQAAEPGIHFIPGHDSAAIQTLTQGFKQ